MAYCISVVSENSLLIITFFILLSPFLHGLGRTPILETRRETLEVKEIDGSLADTTTAAAGGVGGLLPPLTPLLPPLPPLLPPIPLLPNVTDLLNFADQRLAIVYPVIQLFKKTITSDPLGVTKTWVGADICSYKGFFCDHPPDNSSATALAAVDFNGFGLASSTLEGFLDFLPDIAVFHANSNNFTGTISPKISQLLYLYEIDFSNNKFSGEFPTAVLTMAGLSFLDIRFNSFTGSVPATLFTQPLDVLFVNNNDFTSKLPDNLGETSAQYLTLANNQFVGPIPKSIGKAANSLAEVLFLNNQLSGCLPYEIGLLVEATVFDAGSNHLTGPLPCSVGCMKKIQQLNFAGNQLYGTVPEVACALENLQNLSLSDNYFTNVGPTCRGLIERGVLDIRNNCIQDLPLQRSVAECASFLAHRKICLDLPSYSIIPCALSHFHIPFSRKSPPNSSAPSKEQKKKKKQQPPPPRAPSPTYSALIRHRL